MATSQRKSCIVLASFWFSLLLNTLESFWKVHLIYSKGHRNKGFCSIAISMLGQALKFQSLWGFFFFFLHQPFSSEWKLLVFKAADEIGPTVSLCVLGCIEIEFSYFLNQKSVLLSDKYEWTHGDNRTEYLKSRMLWTIWGHVVSVPTRAWLHSNLVKAKWLLLCVWVHGWDRLTICYCLLSFSSVSEWC